MTDPVALKPNLGFFGVWTAGPVTPDEAVEIELWQEASRPLAVGDEVEITAGCDKQLATCRDKFANVVNFRGFPHMPGNDFITSYVRG